MRGTRRSGLLVALLLAGHATVALAAQSVHLHAALVPERLGAGTTIVFSLAITDPHRALPPPMTTLTIRYPGNVGLFTSGMGLQSCNRTTLEEVGPEACPSDSLMGHGTALVEIPIGPETISETGQITTWMGPIENGNLTLLFYADGKTPVSAQVIFPAIIAGATAPFGGQIETQIPLIPNLPGGPNPVVVRMSAAIGPLGITYYTHVHGKRLPYHPRGLQLPPACPHGGFPFEAKVGFINGTAATARTSVACPRGATLPVNKSATHVRT